jgi:hypothetical protein
MTEQEIITAAKTNWLAWQGLKELQPEVAAWMEGHGKDISRLANGTSAVELVHTGLFITATDFMAGNVYRLRPDYEPLKWWFDTITKDVRQGSCAVHSACFEVTAEYADYLRNKPDGECDLRDVEKGDTFFDMRTGNWNVCELGIHTDNPKIPVLRWCKPKPDIAQLRRELVEARARMMEATDAYLDAKHRLDGALRPSK